MNLDGGEEYDILDHITESEIPRRLNKSISDTYTETYRETQSII